MRFKKFEDHISNVLKHDEESLDIQQLIDDIHKKSKKRRTLPFFFWFLGIGIVASTSLIYFEKSDANIKKEEIVSTSTQQIVKSSEPTSVEAVHPSSQRSTSSIQNSTKHKNEVHNQSRNINKNTRPLDQGTQATVESLENKIFSHPKETSAPAALENQSNNYVSIHALPTKSIKPLEYDAELAFNLKTDKVSCPTFSRRNRLMMELIPEIGLFSPFKKLENVIVEPNNVFLLRQQDEQSQLGINAALFFSIRKQGNPFYFKTGLSWSRFSERMPINYNYIRQDTTKGIISVTVSQSGDTITYIYGDIINQRNVNGSKTRYHHFNHWDVPLFIGADKRFGRWSIGVEAGININLSQSVVGSILHSDTSFASINISNPAFKSRLGLSYSAALLLGRDFYKAGRLYLAIRTRWFPSPFSSEQNNISQSYHFIGANLGYMYTF